MPDGSETSIRLATATDAETFGRLLHAFNTEFDDPTPAPDVLAGRAAPLIESGEVVVLLAGDGPDGFAQLRFRPALYFDGPDVYLEELYVVLALRGRGIGRALLTAVLDVSLERGAGHIDLCTGEEDVAARALYESMGFTNREGREGGPRMLYYERGL
jgi:ribosomal protein S18 acetylase RimI-like enzyme